MPAKQTQEGNYKTHPDRWTPYDLKMLDRLLVAFGRDNPLNGECPSIDVHDDVHKACAASWVALRALKKHLVEQGVR